jgi:hypothetical protein
MNGEDGESHYMSEYFGSSGWRRPRRSPVSWLKSERLLLPVSGVACSGSGDSRPLVRLSRKRLATCCLAVLGLESWLSSVELGDHRVELDAAPATSSGQPARPSIRAVQ